MPDRGDETSYVSVQLKANGLDRDTIARVSRALQQTLLNELADIAPGMTTRVQLGSPRRHADRGGDTDGIATDFEDATIES